MNVVNMLVDTADRLPEKTAIVYKSEKWSYRQLKELVFKAANGLRTSGIKENMHVGLMMTNRLEYVVSYFAALAVGAAVVPINPQFKEKELTYVLNDSDASALIYEHYFAETVLNAKDGFKSVNNLISFYGKGNDKCEWSKLLDCEPINQPSERHENDTAQIIYTSGTTGHPKGAMITHDNVLWMTNTVTEVQETSETDKIVVVLPLFHAYAKVACLLCGIYKGATAYLEDRFIPDLMLEMIDREKITVFPGVPTMFTMFVHSPKLKDYDYSSLRIFGSGGASIPVEIIDRIKKEIGVAMLEGYGQTESTVMITCQPLHGEKLVGSVGIPVPGLDLRIVTADDKDVPQGEVGEIIFRGRNAMKGYYNRPEATKETIRDGWVYTGDLGYQDEDGNLFIVDRKKDMIIRGGYNVYPREIEEVLYAHPDIIECAVIGEANEVFGEEIVAYVVTKNELLEEELSSYCKKNMANYKVPRIFRFIEELPKTATGKILKTPLRKNQESRNTK
ncbi:long-chain-fatty-acid--CoA ligase [Alkalihalobacterium chitinilyticum]|uniref:Long-chain fatty acid--CoA ligase n=1 Tax=Alkalihalobacterium chitinilyticum TaxID=2980103 RepID=A0ABT5VGH6_9BACI|nr:long-chain fatty acid--CoA ligase [Alkalihalobacterium chitinilyticum]MDE5414534.1 long-chain fatty acid--CoA ligase [Alkalihalobacterium chitinilyticum]